jgi:hypothetical protein
MPKPTINQPPTRGRTTLLLGNAFRRANRSSEETASGYNCLFPNYAEGMVSRMRITRRVQEYASISAFACIKID